MRKVEKGDFVKICYKTRLESGELLDGTEDCRGMEIEVGAGEVPSGLDDALIGMTQNEKKVVAVGPDEGFGERDERLERAIPRAGLPAGYEPRAGEFIAFQTPKGEQLPAVIKKVEGEYVTVDFNHPMAGRCLVYEVEVAQISDLRSASPTKCESGCCCS